MEFKSMDEVRKHLKCGIPLPVYFVSGADDYRKQGVISKINSITTQDGNGFDQYKFTENASADDIADAAFEITFGGGRRCITAEDIPFSNMGSTEYSKFEQLIKEVAEMNGDTVLIFSFFQIDTSKTDKNKGEKKKNCLSSLKKLIDSVGGGIISCDYATDSELATMMEKEASKNHCSLDRELALYLISRCGNDSALLKNEITKVSKYRGEGKIKIEDINLMTAPSPDASIFELSKKISAGDETGAFKVLYDIKQRGEPTPVIFSILTGFYLDLFRAKTAKLEGKTADDILKDYGKTYGKRAFAVKNAMNAQAKYSLSSITKALEILMEGDCLLKSSGSDENLILDETLARLFACR